MNRDQLRELLREVAEGSQTPDEALRKLRFQPFEGLGYAQVDTHRPLRTGFPEVIFGQGKTAEQMAEIARRIALSGQPVLVTKATPEAYEAVSQVLPRARHHAHARMVTVAGAEPTAVRGRVAVVSAGTSDLPVSEEAAVTAETLGVEVERITDAGVAGLHRLLAQRQSIDRADAIVAVAGMEGALPSVIGGLVDCPVIAVPTSIGYGASFNGIAALLAMLNSCAPGVSVVNIDNGFGGGYQAALIARRAASEAET